MLNRNASILFGRWNLKSDNIPCAIQSVQHVFSVRGKNIRQHSNEKQTLKSTNIQLATTDIIGAQYYYCGGSMCLRIYSTSSPHFPTLKDVRDYECTFQTQPTSASHTINEYGNDKETLSALPQDKKTNLSNSDRHWTGTMQIVTCWTLTLLIFLRRVRLTGLLRLSFDMLLLFNEVAEAASWKEIIWEVGWRQSRPSFLHR